MQNASAGWTESLGSATDIAQVVALFVAGTWAYLKFVRGRTFALRGELTVDGRVVAIDAGRGLHLVVSFRNTGSSRIPFSDATRIARVYAVPPAAWPSTGAIPWGDHVAVAKIFDGHRWIEGQETITDQVLVPVPGEGSLAYQVVCRLGARRREFDSARGFLRKLRFWSTTENDPVVWTTRMYVTTDTD